MNLSRDITSFFNSLKLKVPSVPVHQHVFYMLQPLKYNETEKSVVKKKSLSMSIQSPLVFKLTLTWNSQIISKFLLNTHTHYIHTYTCVYIHTCVYMCTIYTYVHVCVYTRTYIWNFALEILHYALEILMVAICQFRRTENKSIFHLKT